MTNNEIKKLVYKQKPNAVLTLIRGGNLYYNSLIVLSEIDPTVNDDNTKTIYFEVPISDFGTTDFFPTMDGKLLLRYLVNEEN